MKFIRICSLLSVAALLLKGCSGPASTNQSEWKSKRHGVNEVIIHELSDCDKLNPITSTDANSTYIEYNIFMYLLDVNKETLELNPSLAKSRPVIFPVTEGDYAGGIAMEYEIRPEAVWDNGEPVTARDVEFTFKAVKNPLTDCEHLRPYLDFISHIEIDPANPKKFTLFSKEPFFAAEASSGFQAYIIPEYIYDPRGLMKEFSIKQLSSPAQVDKLRGNQKIIEFANEFNSEKYQREKGYVVGCGPYEFVSWTTGQRIVLQKKKNWWGDKLAGQVANFDARPEKLIYEIINDRTTAQTALKDDALDISDALREKDFSDLRNNESFTKMYHLFNPTSLSYVYIGLNMKHPVLADLQVRKALAHAVDREKIMNVLLYGLADPVNGPIHPTKKYYNTALEGYDFDLNKASEILEQAGWKDTDGDGIRDKVMEGKKQQLRFVYKYNAGNDTREKIGLFFKDNCKKIGVEIEIIAKEWTVFLDETKNHNFDIYCGAWISDPTEDDPKQLWHTASYNGGSNYCGFGDTQSDLLIEAIRKEMDEEKRNHLYKQFQAMVVEAVPYIFLYTPNARIIMSKRFENAKAYVARPGYTERELIVAGRGPEAPVAEK
ncbi:MAG TPA: ABC transporter substrate-binding protein [Chitinophagales bacterium]|nr:ABC transporter substrate-binding protein [Chitinophagales bacterium]